MVDCHIDMLLTCCQGICIIPTKTKKHSVLRFDAGILHSLVSDSLHNNNDNDNMYISQG